MTHRQENPTLGQFTALDLFAGSGGLSLGLKQAGFVVEGVEFDALAAEAHRLGVGPCVTMDVRQYHPPHDFDLVAGGFPCQIYSRARTDFGVEDGTKRLWPEALRIAKEANAKAILLENVPNLLSAQTESGLSVAASIKASAKQAGFHVTWAVLQAADFGTPQMRERVFFVGFRDLWRMQEFLWPVPTHDSANWATVQDVFPEVNYPFPSPTVTATEAKSWSGFATKKVDYYPRRALERIAKVTGKFWKPAPEQLGLLQGYPEDFPFVGNIEERYRQVGNSVPVPLGYAVGESVRRMLRLV